MVKNIHFHFEVKWAWPLSPTCAVSACLGARIDDSHWRVIMAYELPLPSHSCRWEWGVFLS